MRRAAMAVVVFGLVAAGCGSGSASPAAATKTVCADARQMQTDANRGDSSGIGDANSNMLGALPALNAGGKASADQQQIGADALALSKRVNDVLTGGGDPGLVSLTITKIDGECSALGD